MEMEKLRIALYKNSVSGTVRHELCFSHFVVTLLLCCEQDPLSSIRGLGHIE